MNAELKRRRQLANLVVKYREAILTERQREHGERVVELESEQRQLERATVQFEQALQQAGDSLEAGSSLDFVSMEAFRGVLASGEREVMLRREAFLLAQSVESEALEFLRQQANEFRAARQYEGELKAVIASERALFDLNQIGEAWLLRQGGCID